jgi:hypothetical protein
MKKAAATTKPQKKTKKAAAPTKPQKKKKKAAATTKPQKKKAAATITPPVPVVCSQGMSDDGVMCLDGHFVFGKDKRHYTHEQMLGLNQKLLKSDPRHRYNARMRQQQPAVDENGDTRRDANGGVISVGLWRSQQPAVDENGDPRRDANGEVISVGLWGSAVSFVGIVFLSARSGTHFLIITLSFSRTTQKQQQHSE